MKVQRKYLQVSINEITIIYKVPITFYEIGLFYNLLWKYIYIVSYDYSSNKHNINNN